MKTVGSQKRELLSESGMSLHMDGDDLSFLSITPENGVILKNDKDGNLKLWIANDDFAGYVIVIDNIGHEFVTTVS